MKYDFDSPTYRRNTNSYKWDTPAADDILPMWVADMDFKTAPAVIDAVKERAALGIYGYTKVPAEYYDALCHWFATRHEWSIDPAHVIYTTGVVPALSAIIKALTKEGDKVIVQTPAYNCFYSSIRNNGCQLLPNPLAYSNGQYAIDFDNLERCCADPAATLMIICNPHNPVGRLWSRDELLRIADICRRHGVTPVSDEIHCELTYAAPYTPFAPVALQAGVEAVVCVSPSKAFNIAGLQIANIVAPNAEMRAKIDRAININEVCDVNPFGVDALIAAYRRGGEWLDALRKYLWGNYVAAKEYFEHHLPQCPMAELQATYLLWIDISATGLGSDEFADRLLSEQKLMVSPGSIYGPGGENHIRLNIACQRSRVEDALCRLRAFIASLR